MRRLALAALLALAACRPRKADLSPAPAAEPPFAGLTLDLTPDPARGELSVSVRISGDRAAEVHEITVARAWADTRAAEALTGLTLRDGEGALPLRPQRDDGGPDDVYVLSRPPRGGDLVLHYRARANVGPSRFALRVGPDRMTGVGHAFLLLPRVAAPLPARVRFHTGALRRGADAASSFGFGADVTTTATSEDLAHAAYVAGMLWQEHAEAGPTTLVVIGDPPFDTRTALGHAVAARSAVDAFFAAPPEPGPFTVFLVAQPGLGRAREGAALTQSLAVFFDTAQPLDPALDLVMAHELVHRFIGGTVRLTGRDGREAVWFTEGFTVHLARRALLAGGLLTSEGFAADLNRTLGEGGDEALPPAYVRGARYAAWFDAALRRASHGKRSLDDVVRALVVEARGAGKEVLPVAALRDALVRGIGPEAGPLVDRLEAADDTPIDLPDDAFAPCARRTVRERPRFDLGFDRASLEARPAIVHGLVKGSAADRAGLRDGTLVLSAKVPPPSAGDGAQVELWLADGKRVRYRPVGVARETVWEPGACAIPERRASP